MTKIDEWAKENRLDYDSYKDMILGLKKAISEEINEIDWIKRRIIDEKRKHGKEGVAWAKIAQEKIKSEIKRKLCGEVE